MTLKEQEKLFLSAILSTLDIRAVQKVVTEYNRLKDLPKLRKEMKEKCPIPFNSKEQTREVMDITLNVEEEKKEVINLDMLEVEKNATEFLTKPKSKEKVEIEQNSKHGDS